MAGAAIVSIDARDRTPIYAQLDRGLRAAIVTGRLRPGDQPPTAREMAVEVEGNSNTRARAYAELEREGVLEPRRGVGSFVAATPGAARSATEHTKRLRAFV